jgi:transposase
VIAKWLGEQNIDILGPWPGKSPDLNPIETLWLNRRVDKLQPFITQEWAAISQDVAQKLIDSIPGRIAEVLKKKGQHGKY